jgi:hypothetical protein
VCPEDTSIPDITYPQSIIEKLEGVVDRFVMGSMQYYGVPRSFYVRYLPDFKVGRKQDQLLYEERTEGLSFQLTSN